MTRKKYTFTLNPLEEKALECIMKFNLEDNVSRQLGRLISQEYNYIMYLNKKKKVEKELLKFDR